MITLYRTVAYPTEVICKLVSPSMMVKVADQFTKKLHLKGYM